MDEALIRAGRTRDGRGSFVTAPVERRAVLLFVIEAFVVLAVALRGAKGKPPRRRESSGLPVDGRE
ncbi:hypothetical protein IFM12276_05870 [Nocardia sputorum]|uniref:Uncharacterized protein n=1 Tax=Nocardia sputorum TaxID=2984338 RepID=A0ABM8CRG9_9NOCA|nr:hypothetical protein IFM12276_05870 [Nocardia sputorum]